MHASFNEAGKGWLKMCVSHRCCLSKRVGRICRHKSWPTSPRVSDCTCIIVVVKCIKLLFSFCIRSASHVAMRQLVFRKSFYKFAFVLKSALIKDSLLAEVVKIDDPLCWCLQESESHL